MSNTYRESGGVVDITASGAAIAVNSVVVVGHMLAIAATTIPDGETGTGEVEGVHRLPKTAGAGAINKGTAPVWDASAGAFVPEGTALAAGDVSGAATCWKDAADGDEWVEVKLNTGHGTVGS